MTTQTLPVDLALPARGHVSPGGMAVLNPLIANLRLSVTRCPRGVVLLFNRTDRSVGSRRATAFGYVQLPIDGARGTVRARGALLEAECVRTPEAIFTTLRDILLSRMRADQELFDGFARLIAAAICVLAEQHQWCFTALGRAGMGGLARWQEERAKSFMTEHMGEPLAVEEVARFCGMSTPHFARAFKISTGLPPYRWLIKQRIERAKTLLGEGDAALVDISVECGFAEQSHFTHAFRREVGVTPGAWRMANRKRAVDGGAPSRASRAGR